MTDSNPKTAVGRLKPNLHAIPPSAMIALGLAMENGETKYGLMNWRQDPISTSTYYDAALRHLLSWWDGEDKAHDSQIHHLAHVMACCAILIDAEIGGNLLNDRPAPGPAAEMIGHLWDQRLAAAVSSVMPASEQVATPETLADEVDKVNADRNPFLAEYLIDDVSNPSHPEYFDGLPRGVDRKSNPFWRNLFHKPPKETLMATELQTMIDAVHRSEASSEKTRQLVLGLGAKIDAIRVATTDPTAGAALTALAAELNAETDAVDTTEAKGEGSLVDPAPPAAPPPVEPPVADPTPAPVEPVPADPAAPADPNLPADPPRI